MATDLNPAVRTLCLTMWWGRIEKSFLFSLLWSNVRRGDPSLTSVARQLGENDNADEDGTLRSYVDGGICLGGTECCADESLSETIRGRHRCSESALIVTAARQDTVRFL